MEDQDLIQIIHTSTLDGDDFQMSSMKFLLKFNYNTAALHTIYTHPDEFQNALSDLSSSACYGLSLAGCYRLLTLSFILFHLNAYYSPEH